MRAIRTRLRDAATPVAASLDRLGLLALLERRTAHRPDVLRVLTYHRVAEPGAEPDLHPGLVSATPAGFAEQMACLARAFRVVSAEEVLAALRAERLLPPRAVLLTFDDAYVDFAEHAWPVLRRHGLPVTLFVPTAYPDRPDLGFWWDRLHHAVTATPDAAALARLAADADASSPAGRLRICKALRERVKALPHDAGMALVDEVCRGLTVPAPPGRVLGWDALRRLAREGVTLASHTRTHPMLSRISPERCREEVAGSLEDLRREIGSVLPIFAYPSGGVSDAAVRVLEKEGIELAFATRRGVNPWPSPDRLRLRRVPVGLHAGVPFVRAELGAWTLALRRPGRGPAT